MQRSPGDTTTKEKTSTCIWKSSVDGVPVTSSNITMKVERDYRPTYPYGNRGKIGNTTWIYPTAYKHYSRTVNPGGTSYITYPKSGGRTGREEYDKAPVDGIGASYITMDAFYKNNSRSAAQVKALNAIGGQAANIGEDLATYAQTVRLFGSKATLLKNALKAMKSKDAFKNYLYRSARYIRANGDKAVAQAYLEYVYGLKPLAEDIYGVYNLLKQYSQGIKPIIVHGHGSSTQGGTSEVYGQRTSSSGTHQGTCTEIYKSKCDLYGRVNPDLIAFRMLNQLGLLNPAALAWELTPWSFVADWLIPIGPVLNAFTAPVGLNFISGTTATKMSRTYQGEFQAGVPKDAAQYIEDEHTDFTVIDEGYDRITHPTWPFPTPYLNLNPLAGDRWLKALALAIVNVKR